MASSRAPKIVLANVGEALAQLTPGPLGHNDYASPNCRSPGRSPGPLGTNDHASPFICYKQLGANVSPEQLRVISLVMTPTSGANRKLKEKDFVDAANALGGASVAILKAFAEVECGGKSGFGPDGLPVIAYEGHIFRRLTLKRHDAINPTLSYRYTAKAGSEWRKNNSCHSASWKTLRAAMELDIDAALQSCSWGMFQIMGFNYKGCGFNKLQEFIAAMKAGEREQLFAFVEFCKSRSNLSRAIMEKDFQKMALLYNGADYGDYDKLIERSYRKYSKPAGKNN